MHYKGRIEDALAACVKVLRAHELKVVVAESCTGGRLGGALSDLPGSSQWFVGGVIAYDEALKRSLLGVDEAVLATCGAVSEETVAAMCAGALKAVAHADIAVAVSGYAGPTGEPAGKVCFGVLGRSAEPEVRCEVLEGARGAVREAAVARALTLCGDYCRSYGRKRNLV